MFKTNYLSPKEWLVEKNKARERDKDTCQKCGKKREKGKKALDLHHIDTAKAGYWHKDSKNNRFVIIRVKAEELISLCRSCHKKAHFEK